MPYKLKDPGVTLSLRRRGEGKGGDLRQAPPDLRQRRPDAQGQVLGVRQPRHALVDRWDFVLKGEKPPADAFEWKGWKAIRQIQLADDRVKPPRHAHLLPRALEVPESLPDVLFSAP